MTATDTALVDSLIEAQRLVVSLLTALQHLRHPNDYSGSLELARSIADDAIADAADYVENLA